MKIKIITLLVFTLFIVGCIGLGGEDHYDPYFGTEGLSLEFLENAPPYEAYESQEVPIGLIIKNNGAYDINRGFISIGVENDYMTTPEGADRTFVLAGRDSQNEYGEEKTRMFYSVLNPLDSLSKIHTSSILITACYSYQNYFGEEVCIDTDIFGTYKGEKPCSVGEKSYSGQGGPLGITHIKEVVTKPRDVEDVVIPLFEITIENLGHGDVINPNNVEDYCSSTPVDNKVFNQFYIEGNLGGETELICEPENPLRLRADGTTRVLCKTEEGLPDTGTAYVSILSINLYYGYTNTNSEEIIINKLPS